MSLPPVADAFRWTQEFWGAALRCRPLEPVAPHLFTTRQLELSAAGYQQVAEALGAKNVATRTQVHGVAVYVVRNGQTGTEEQPEADVLLSDDPDVAVGIRTADCVPILLADRARGAVAAVHAGWRGTAAGAATTALEAMARVFGTRAEDVIAAIGPSIGPCCYEVGSELVDAFAAAGHERHLIERWFASPPPPRGSRERRPLRLNLAGANRDQLLLAGVPEHQVHGSGLCTAMHLDVLTSYRAEKEKAGRMLAVIKPG